MKTWIKVIPYKSDQDNGSKGMNETDKLVLEIIREIVISW